MIEFATALLILLGFAFVPLVVPFVAVAVGSVSGRRHHRRTSPAQAAVRAARARSEARRAAQHEPLSLLAPGARSGAGDREAP